MEKNQLHPSLQLSSLKLPPFCYLILKQEGYGPHRSPEETVKINKHIGLYHNVDISLVDIGSVVL